MKHHPNCLFWPDNYSWECTCGLTAPRPAESDLMPWTAERWDAFAAKMNAMHRVEETP